MYIYHLCTHPVSSTVTIVQLSAEGLLFVRFVKLLSIRPENQVIVVDGRINLS